MNIENKVVVIDGTTGGEITVLKEFHVIQLAVSGRATGLVTVKAKGLGSDVFESFSPELQLDLAIERTSVIEGYSIEALRFDVLPVGANYSVTITQWPTN